MVSMYVHISDVQGKEFFSALGRPYFIIVWLLMQHSKNYKSLFDLKNFSKWISRIHLFDCCTSNFLNKCFIFLFQITQQLESICLQIIGLVLQKHVIGMFRDMWKTCKLIIIFQNRISSFCVCFFKEKSHYFTIVICFSWSTLVHYSDWLLCFGGQKLKMLFWL